MALSILFSRALIGIEALEVFVEVHISAGLPSFSIVGLPETSVKESKERVRSAIINSNYTFPVGKITVNLAPAEIPKEGGKYDLAIAVGILAASGQVQAKNITAYELAGELSLSGQLKSIKGVISLALFAKKSQRALIIPAENKVEASLIKDANIYHAHNLTEVVDFFNDQFKLAQSKNNTPIIKLQTENLNFNQVIGQSEAKRVLEIAAAGGHHALLCGPPGAGKTMLAERFTSILPPLCAEKSLEVAALYNLSNKGFNKKYWQQHPFRSPHHTATFNALVGGGAKPQPGEISLAHNGVLFLDEFAEFDRNTIETLREPLESGQITISRVRMQVTYPAQFQLLTALNPCPCGYLTDENKTCRCSRIQIERYRGKISGPILDRIDLQIDIPNMNIKTLETLAPEKKSTAILTRVTNAQSIQLQRQAMLNSKLPIELLTTVANLKSDAQKCLINAMQKFCFSMRAYHRIVRVARTIADLNGSTHINKDCALEALSYKQFNNKEWL